MREKMEATIQQIKYYKTENRIFQGKRKCKMNYNKKHENIILISIQNNSLCTRNNKRYILVKVTNL